MNELLKYKNQYKELFYFLDVTALEEIKKDGMMLRYVKDQTLEICLAAVRQNGHALEFVRNQTEEICLAAIRQNINALRYVNIKFFKEKEKTYDRYVCDCSHLKGVSRRCYHCR